MCGLCALRALKFQTEASSSRRSTTSECEFSILAGPAWLEPATLCFEGRLWNRHQKLSQN